MVRWFNEGLNPTRFSRLGRGALSAGRGLFLGEELDLAFEIPDSPHFGRKGRAGLVICVPCVDASIDGRRFELAISR